MTAPNLDDGTVSRSLSVVTNIITTKNHTGKSADIFAGVLVALINIIISAIAARIAPANIVPNFFLLEIRMSNSTPNPATMHSST